MARRSFAEYDWPAFGKGAILMEDSLVQRVWLPGLRPAHAPPSDCQTGGGTPARELSRRLENWLAGKAPWPDAEFDLTGMPPFRSRVLRACAKIQPGRMLTYAALAAKAGNKSAARAAGSAMARNPFPLLIPCHRVVPSGGGCGNYGGGEEMKRWLLEFEAGASPASR